MDLNGLLDFRFTILVQVRQRTVCYVEVKPSTTFGVENNKRRTADQLIRDRIGWVKVDVPFAKNLRREPVCNLFQNLHV
jgi:hypothetical protein